MKKFITALVVTIMIVTVVLLSVEKFHIIEIPYLPNDVGFFIVFMGIIYLFLKYEKIVRSRRVNEEIKFQRGGDGWATNADIARIGLRPFSDKDENGTIIGENFLIRDYYHLLTVAPTREGKGVNLIIPNLLLKPSSSFVVTDLKGENACITAAWQKRSGQKVYIIDPWETQKTIKARHGIPSSGFNPFDFIRHNPDRIVDNCALVARLLLPENAYDKDPYWNNAARNLIRVCLLHIISFKEKSMQNFETLYNMLHPLTGEWAIMLVEMEVNKAFDGLVARLSAEFRMPISENPMSGILSNAQTALGIFESPHLKKSLAKSEFNPFELINGNCTVYVVMSYNYLATHATWLRLVVGLCFNACAEKANKKVKFILDEFGVLGKMEEVEKGLKFLAGKNISIWPFVQDLGTLKKIYGVEGLDMFVAGSSVFNAFGVNDPFTSKYISDKLGKITVEKVSGGKTQSGKEESFSTNWSMEEKDLLSPHEVEKEENIIMFYKKLNFRLQKQPYYFNSILKSRAGSLPKG
jgi:type IV secretion system protein VirD4